MNGSAATTRMVSRRTVGLATMSCMAALAVGVSAWAQTDDARAPAGEAPAEATELSPAMACPATWWQRKDDHNGEMRRIFQAPGYWWKHRRERPPALTGPGWLVRLLQWSRDTARSILRWLGRLLRQLARAVGLESAARAISQATGLRLTAWVLFAVAAAVLAVFVTRQIRHLLEVRRLAGRAEDAARTATPTQAPERLLPSAHMAQRAREHCERGDFKQAIRYLFLAALSRLEETRHVTYVPHKTNHAYLAEVAGQADIVQVLRPFILIFDRTWYGEHGPARPEFDVVNGYYRQVVRSTA